MKRATAIAIAAMCVSWFATQATAADTKVGGVLFAEWMWDQTDGADDANEFSLGRAYLTVKSKLSDQTSVRITTDLRQTTDTDGKDRYDIIVKYGYLDWRPTPFNNQVGLRFGLHQTPYIDTQNKLWGRRYLTKTPSDLYGYMTSSDLGASVMVNLGDGGKYGWIQGSVFNGTSYSNLGDANSNKDLNGFVKFTPFAENSSLEGSAIVGQYYFGTQNIAIPDTDDAGDWDRRLASFGGLLAYDDVVDLGADLNFYTLGQGPGNEDLTQSAMAFHGTVFLAGIAPDSPALRTLDLFGRVDMVDQNTDVDNDGLTHLIVGIECVPVKGFKAAVNYRLTTFEDDTTDDEKFLFLNTMVDF